MATMRTPFFTLVCVLSLMVLAGVAFNVECLKPEISHKFREPEKRPSVIITTAFTLLAASPAFILFALWSKTTTLSLDSMTLRRLIFQVLLALVLLTYARFYFGTNMFETLRYAIPLIAGLFYTF